MSQLRFVPFLPGQKAGIIVVSIFVLVSFLALVSVALRVLWLAVRRRLSANHTKPEYVFFNTQLGHYAACLLVANLFIEVAGLAGIHWSIQNGITEGAVCTAQAILNQIGNWATAYFTVSIAVHAFNSLVLRKRQSILVSATTISVGWILAGLLAGAPSFNPGAYKFGSAYGADGLTCGVRSVYLTTTFFFHLLPIFLTSIFSTVLYSIIFLVLRGTLNFKRRFRLTLDPNERWVVGKVPENYHRFVARIARSMLWYPVGYIILLIPYSVTRLLQISGFLVPFGLVVFAYTCWAMLGAVNVLLLYNTFSVLGPALNVSAMRIDNESFGTPERSKSRWGSYDEKSAQYISTHSSEKTNSQPSVHALFLAQAERAATAQSFYSHAPSPPLDRTITPVADLSRTIASLESAKDFPIAEVSGHHDRQISAESLGLPAPPRRTRSPLLRLPSMQSNRSTVRTVNALRPPAHPHLSTSYTLGSPGPDSVELSPSAWRSGRSSHTSGQPMLSALNVTFPSPISRPPHSALPHHSHSLSAVPGV